MTVREALAVGERMEEAADRAAESHRKAVLYKRGRMVR